MAQKRKTLAAGILVALGLVLGAALWLRTAPGRGSAMSAGVCATKPRGALAGGSAGLIGSATSAAPAQSRAKSAQDSLAAQRVERVQQLCRQREALDPGEIEALCSFLLEAPQAEGISVGRAAELKNAIMNKLGRQAPERLEAVLLRVDADTERQPEVIRDYALQHLCAWYDRLPDQAAARQVFWRHSSEGRATDGTALLALSRVESMGQLPPDERERLRQTARATASNVSASESARMASLDILRCAGDAQALEAARALLRQSPSKAAAIAALGAIGARGNAEDAQWLKNDPNLAGDPALAPAFQHALAQLATQNRGKQ
jgi:hypothetical protein